MAKKKKKGLGGKIIFGILKSPYYIGKGVYRMIKKTEQKTIERRMQKRREGFSANFENFNVINTSSGKYEEWFNDVLQSESRIGIILGARGSGKSAFGIKLLENLFSKTRKKCYAMGFKKEEMPSWIEVVEKVDQLKNNAVVLIDEGGILFSSRKSMSAPNKLLSDLILIARHKNLTILFISQNSSNLDVNIIRQADFLVLKPTSLLQKDFERKKIRDIYSEVEKEFENYRDDKGITHIYSGKFRGFVSNPLPSFWSVGLSKSFG